MKILLWDIETSPMLVTTWTLYPEKLEHDNIVRESTLICAAWKWFGETTIESVAINPRNPEDDKPVIVKLHEVLSQAEVLVAHNGDSFDLPKFAARAIYHGLPPVPPIPTIDTKVQAKKIAAFNSNRLDYLGGYFKVGRKIPTHYSLWQKVMAGDEKALKKMVRYNKEDVRLLERVYCKLRPWIRNHPNANLYGKPSCCPTCGSQDFIKEGLKFYRVTSRQQYKCLSCGAWFSGETVETVKLR